MAAGVWPADLTPRYLRHVTVIQNHQIWMGLNYRLVLSNIHKVSHGVVWSYCQFCMSARTWLSSSITLDMRIGLQLYLVSWLQIFDVNGNTWRIYRLIWSWRVGYIVSDIVVRLVPNQRQQPTLDHHDLPIQTSTTWRIFDWVIATYSAMRRRDFEELQCRNST